VSIACGRVRPGHVAVAPMVLPSKWQVRVADRPSDLRGAGPACAN